MNEQVIPVVIQFDLALAEFNAETHTDHYGQCYALITTTTTSN